MVNDEPLQRTWRWNSSDVMWIETKKLGGDSVPLRHAPPRLGCLWQQNFNNARFWPKKSFKLCGPNNFFRPQHPGVCGACSLNRSMVCAIGKKSYPRKICWNLVSLPETKSWYICAPYIYIYIYYIYIYICSPPPRAHLRKRECITSQVWCWIHSKTCSENTVNISILCTSYWFCFDASNSLIW